MRRVGLDFGGSRHSSSKGGRAARQLAYVGGPGGVGSVRDQTPQRIGDGGGGETGLGEVVRGGREGVSEVVMGGVSVVV
jgi:hypothetical protein